MILKHSAHKDTINIKEIHDGIDFFFAQRNHAEKFVEFLSSVAPVRTKKSQELISTDIHTSSKSYKFSFSVELVPICRDDLVALPIKLARQMGNISPLTLCYRIGTSVNLIDPQTLQTTDISPPTYWHTPFAPLADVQDLVEFIVLDIEPITAVDTVGPSKGRFLLAEATVARAADLGSNDTTYYCRTHLGGIVQPGDSVMGYMLNGTNFNNPQYEALEEHNKYSSQLPDVVLVKKHYPRKKKSKNRNWRLKRMAKEEGEMAPRKQDADRLERDFEMFLRDVEEDHELRNALSLYRRQKHQQNAEDTDMDEGTEVDEDEALQIPMEQLLDDFEEMGLEDQM